jgi:carboxylate-amine ligase
MSFLYSAVPPFREGPGFWLGVGEEIHVVDPDTLAPRRMTDALLEQGDWLAGRARGDVCDGLVELITPQHTNAADAVRSVRALRVEAMRRGAGLIGAGLHPTAAFGDVRYRSGRRHELVAGAMRGVLRQTPPCGLGVHVGMPDADTAIRACNGMRKWIPLLQALGANSPFWYGEDSGLASARSVICNSFPRSGIPRAFLGYEDFEATVRELQAVGDCPDYSSFWWDLRPHPALGTLEIRAVDAQSSPEDLAAIVALAHCLVVHEAGASGDPHLSSEALAAMSFVATRDGLDARVPFDAGTMPARHAAVLALALVGHHAVDLGCWDELMLVQRLLDRGNGAVRQREAARRGGVHAALRLLAEETMCDRPPEGRFSRRRHRQDQAAAA